MYDCANQYTGQTPPARTQQADVEDEEVLEVEEVNIIDLISRSDISNFITKTLISEVNDKNWKVRWFFLLDYFHFKK